MRLPSTVSLKELLVVALSAFISGGTPRKQWSLSTKLLKLNLLSIFLVAKFKAHFTSQLVMEKMHSLLSALSVLLCQNFKYLYLIMTSETFTYHLGLSHAQHYFPQKASMRYGQMPNMRFNPDGFAAG